MFLDEQMLQEAIRGASGQVMQTSLSIETRPSGVNLLNSVCYLAYSDVLTMQ